MSFGDMGAGSAASRQTQPRQRRDDLESPLEKSIRSHVQELQGSVRKAADLLDMMQRNNHPSKRSSESLDKFLQEGRAVATTTEQLFRDWTVQMTGEPSERHRKKFSYEKLQKAFEEEVAHLKDVARRAVAFQQQDSPPRSMANGGMQSVVDACEEDGLLDDSTNFSMGSDMDGQLLQQSRVAEERQSGIRRIQTQVSEVNQIFKDLASIVSEQGQQFATIEQSAEVAVNSTRTAVAELKKTVDRTRSSRERLCCMLLAAVLLLCFVVYPHVRSVETSEITPRVASEVSTQSASVIAASATVSTVGAAAASATVSSAGTVHT